LEDLGKDKGKKRKRKEEIKKAEKRKIDVFFLFF